MLWVTRRKLDRERPDGDAIAGGDGLHPMRRFHAVLVELPLHESERERRPIDGSAQERRDIRHRPDVILMTVGQQQRLQLVPAALEILELRDDQVHPWQVRLGKHRPSVDDDGGVPARDGHHVEAELAQAAERHDLDRSPGGRVTSAGGLMLFPDIGESRPSHHSLGLEKVWSGPSADSPRGARVDRKLKPLGRPEKTGAGCPVTITRPPKRAPRMRPPVSTSPAGGASRVGDPLDVRGGQRARCGNARLDRKRLQRIR
jgi:hypothetical protein